MASILKVDALQGVTAAGSILVTGEGNSTTTNLQQGLAKCWGHFEGSDATLDDSFNSASLTDNGTGDFSANFSNNMGSVSYTGSFQSDDASNTNASAFATSSIRIQTRNSVNTVADRDDTIYTTFGDLA